MSKVDTKAQTLLFRMLSNDVRLRILESLIKDEKSVGELCRCIEEEQTRVSHELQRLSACGLVRQRRQGKLVIYTINDKKMVRCILQAANIHVEKFAGNANGFEFFSKPKGSVSHGFAI